MDSVIKRLIDAFRDLSRYDAAPCPAALVRFGLVPADAQLLIIFEVAERLDGMMNDGGVLLSCLDVQGFIDNAKPALDFCADNCHAGGDMSATNATNMVLLNSPDQMQQEQACGQILSRVYLEDPANSGIVGTDITGPETASADVIHRTDGTIVVGEVGPAGFVSTP